MIKDRPRAIGSRFLVKKNGESLIFVGASQFTDHNQFVVCL
jgi:hypothetical protein